ncbi:DarT ssDNA thymidine ADP-ribosyltransferase family protein [Azospirillum sp. B2RO_4]|uniref:DarT ssDNA thymidine ADP-ribosyltransferase family protein n=1 Tax=Azospirillum sp. B2RO_4 TaxID=3027796 RepID=UPI003DA8DE2A
MSINDLIARINASSQHRCLYHFTDASNLQTIKEKGLLSKAQMRLQGWWPAATGGNALSHQLDEHRGISKYVSLCFTNNHPMKHIAYQQGRLPSPRYLRISANVLRIAGVKVAFGVANANDTKIMHLSDAIPHMDLDVIYSRTNWSDAAIQARLQKAEKMELLVPDIVPSALISWGG